jgi:hypothetical protein
MSHIDSRIILGRKERVSFPEFHIEGVVAKIDSGAYSGAIHAKVLGEVQKNGSNFLQFSLLDTTHPKLSSIIHETADFRKKTIHSSNGTMSHRYVIKTTLGLGGTFFPVEISLSDRSTMRCPVLVGRKFMSKDFLIDVCAEFLTS